MKVAEILIPRINEIRAEHGEAYADVVRLAVSAAGANMLLSSGLVEARHVLGAEAAKRTMIFALDALCKHAGVDSRQTMETTESLLQEIGMIETLH